MIDKSASGLPTLKRSKLMFIYNRFSTKERILSFLVLRFKNCIYTLTLYFRWRQSFNSQPGKCEYQRKNLCQSVNMENNSNSNYEKTLCQVKVCKKLFPCQLEGSKKPPRERVKGQYMPSHIETICYNVSMNINPLTAAIRASGYKYL